MSSVILLRRCRALIAGVFLVLVVLAGDRPPVHAQSATATLSGVIADETGAVLTDVRVTVLNMDTRLERTATTNGKGLFVVPLLPPGRYTVLGERTGFASAEMRNVTLNATDQLVLRVQMTLAGVGEEVRVIAEPPRVNLSPGVSTVVDQQFVKNLPMNGRSFQRLIQLSPGVVPVTSTYGGGEFSINGQRANANYFTIDGVSANSGASASDSSSASHRFTGALPVATADGGTNTLVSLEAIQEFTIQTSAFAPEFGRMPGGQIGITTRSGSNSYHGSGSIYFRDDALDATDWFVNRQRLPKPPLRLWDAGGTLGGPLRADRLFFFGSYEDLRLDLPGVAVMDVPSRATRAAATPALREILDGFPQPTGADQPNGYAEFASTFTNPSRAKAFSLRLDGAAGRWTWFTRYNTGPSSKSERGLNVGYSLNTASHTVSRVDGVTAGSTQRWSSSVVNDIRINYTRATGSGYMAMDDSFGARVPPLALRSPAGSDDDVWFIRMLPGGRGTWIGNGTRADNTTAQVNLVDTLSITHGTHQAKFGLDYRYLMPTIAPYEYSLDYTIDLARVAAGVVQSVAVVRRTDALHPRFYNVSLFAQDTWQLSGRLTATYGLRWELNPPPTERDGREPYLAIGVDDVATSSIAPPGTPAWNTRYSSLAPRVGLAYQLARTPGREMTVRAAAGLFYDLGTGQATRAYFGAPFTVSRQTAEASFPLDAHVVAAPEALTTPHLIVGFDPELKTPVTYQWNVSLERALGSAQSVTASYVGAAGRDLLRMVTYRNPNARFSDLFYTDNSASSDYRALQLQYRRRLSKGLQASVAYTWAEATDNASRDDSLVADATKLDPASDWGASDFDVRHNLSAAATYVVPGAPRLLGAVFGGWSIDGIVVGRTALPVNVFTGQSLFGVGAGTQRPNVVPGVPSYLDDQAAPGGRRINRAAFVAPAANTQGNLPRNALRGFGAFQIDLAVRRRVPLWPGLTGQLGIELFNVTNRPNFASPEGRLSSTQFGLASQTLATSLGNGRNPLYQLGGPRSVQISVKVEF